MRLFSYALLCLAFLPTTFQTAAAQSRAALYQKRAAQASLPDGKDRITALAGLAYDYLQFDFDSAQWFARETLRVSRKVGDQWGEASYYIWAATVQNRQGLPDAATANLDTALTVAEAAQDITMQAGAWQTKGNILFDKNQYYEALACMSRAEQLANRTSKARLKTGIQIDKSRIHRALGEIESAVTACYAAIHLADSMGRSDLAAHAYASLSNIYAQGEDENQLREAIRLAAASADKADNRFLKAQATYMEGSADALGKKYESARTKMEEAMAVYQAMNRLIDASQVAVDLSKVLAHLKQFDRSEALLNGLDTAIFKADVLKMHEYRQARALMLEETGRFGEAESWYKKNVEAAERLQDRRTINWSYTDLSKFYERRLNYPAALAAARSAKQELNESPFAVSMRRAIEKELAIRNEKDKAIREKQVAVLESDKLRSDLLVEQQQKALLETRFQTERQQHTLSALEAQQSLQACELESKDVSLREAQLVREKQAGEVALLSQEKTLQSAQLRAERLYRLLLAGLFVAGLLALYFFYRRLQRSRLLELRANIAQDLHDDLGSEMSGISLASFSAARSGDPARMGEALQNIAGQSSRLVEDMRDIVWSIHPDNDSLEKIAARMRQYAAQMLEPQDVAVQFQVAANALPLKMQPEARKHLYLFFKESIHNIARHARCTQANVGIRRENGSFVIEIRDNGQGFDPAAPPKTTGGNGLRNLRHRAEVLGGKLVMESRPGAGTVLRLVAPLK